MKEVSHRYFWVAVITTSLLGFLLVRSLPKEWELIRVQGMQQFVYIDASKERSRETYDAVIRQLCSPRKHCFLRFWSERRLIPPNLPMTDEELNAMIAYFDRNPFTGLEKFSWNCRIRNDPKHCFSN